MSLSLMLFIIVLILVIVLAAVKRLDLIIAGLFVAVLVIIYLTGAGNVR